MLKTSIKDYVALKKAELKEKIADLGFTPVLAVIQVGSNPASNSYIAGKKRDCDEVGINYIICQEPEDITEDELIDTINLCCKLQVNGIIVQLPLPDHIDVKNIQRCIPLDKDVDGFRVDSPFEPCTPLGVINYLKHNDYQFAGKDALVIGRSDIVGKPLARMLTDLDCTVTLAHSKTIGVDNFTHGSDIVFTCIDKINYFDAVYDFHSRTDIVDIGLGRNASSGKLCGNLNLASVEIERANREVLGVDNFIISGTGGVGLLTRLTLLENVYKAARMRGDLE